MTVSVLVDAQYLEKCMQKIAFDRKISRADVLVVFAQAYELACRDGEPATLKIYDAIFPETNAKDLVRRRADIIASQEFHDLLRQKGAEIILGRLVFRPTFREKNGERVSRKIPLANLDGVWTQKEVDVRLALDLVQDAGNHEHIVLVAGDSDFCPAIERAKEAGAIITMIGSRANTSVHTQKLVDVFVELSDLFPAKSPARAQSPSADQTRPRNRSSRHPQRRHQRPGKQAAGTKLAS